METHLKGFRRLWLWCVKAFVLFLYGKSEERVGCNWFYIGGFFIILDDALRTEKCSFTSIKTLFWLHKVRLIFSDLLLLSGL